MLSAFPLRRRLGLRLVSCLQFFPEEFEELANSAIVGELFTFDLCWRVVFGWLSMLECMDLLVDLLDAAGERRRS